MRAVSHDAGRCGGGGGGDGDGDGAVIWPLMPTY